MYRNKKDVDQHVETLITKLSSKEFFARGYSIGRLYYEVGDYSSCRRYVEQYLSQTDNNAAAHALLGQALHKLGLKEKALEEFKTSYGICPSQKSLVLNICEILADGEVDVDTGRAKYWCDKAETMFPNHPVTFKLREKLMSIANPDPKAHAILLTEELAIRPKDVLLHIRLLNLYLKNNDIEEAFTHCCNVEFSENNFKNNIEWYKILAKVLNTNPRNTSDWNFQLLLLTVAERMCSLSLTEFQNSSSINTLDAIEFLHVYDQALDKVANAGIDAGYCEFHTSLLQHHRSQFAFLAATFLLKKCKDKNWTDIKADAVTLMLIAWHSSPFDPASNWVNSSPKNQQNAARRWYTEGSYRCSQAGHYILSNVKNNQLFLDRVSQTVNGTDWKGELYGRIFSGKYHLKKNSTSHLMSESFNAPSLRLPKTSEVQIYDEEAQRAYGNSLHHYVWMLLNYKDFSQFKCTSFDALPLSNQNNANCFPESLCQLDVYAFLYCAALTTNQNHFCQTISTRSELLPANITEMLCTLAQMKWWDCAFKFSRNELGTEMTDILATLSRGIEVVRCIDYHGLDPELLWKVGCIFEERAKYVTDIDDKRNWNLRAVLYFSAAIPLLEKVRRDIKPHKSMFEYTNNSTLANESSLLEECKLHVAVYQLDSGEYEKAINLLQNLKCAQALYYLGVAYKKMALDENSYQANNTNDQSDSNFLTLMSKAQGYGAEAIDKLKNTTCKSNHKLYKETEELLREIETHLNGNNSILETSDNHGKNSSDEFISLRGNDSTTNIFSTPKRQPETNSSNYSTPAQFLENKLNNKYSGHVKRQTSNLQQNDTIVESVIELYKSMFEENRVLGTQIINTMKNTTDQFSLLKISVDQVKSQIDECKNECKDVSELKKQIAELKKDITKLKKTSSEQAMVDNELLNLGEEYNRDNASTYAAQLPFTAQQVMPPFNQRLIPPFSVPPSPFQMYGQNLFNLYNQYSQFSQGPPVPGAPLFDAARSQVNYPGVFPTADQMYIDVANLVQQAMPTAPTVSAIPTAPATSIVPPLPVVTLSHSTAPTTPVSKPSNFEAKEIPKPTAAANVAISSEHISTATPEILTTPPKNGKGIPHNYQIQMPEMKSNKNSPSFSFPTFNKSLNSSLSTFDWNTPKMFNSPVANLPTTAVTFSPNQTNDEIINGPASDSHNKTRTTSEKSNTSVDNYDPCPDFKPIIPLPAEVKVTTGEENESVIFSARAKLYRYVDNQWKERGLGEMKLLKHRDTGKVRVLMRREQVHKICANHIITTNMEIIPMKNETKAYCWVANDFADEKLVLEKFSIRFKTEDIAKQFYETFNKARFETEVGNKDSQLTESFKTSSHDRTVAPKSDAPKSTNEKQQQPAKTVFGGFTFSSTPAFKPVDEKTTDREPVEKSPNKVNVFSGLQFKTGTSSLLSNLLTAPDTLANKSNNGDQEDTQNKSNVSSEYVEDFEPTAEFKPVIPMLALVDTKTGEEDEIVLFEHRAKLLRFSAPSKEWKERGLGNIKILANKENDKKIRLLMRREQVMKVCCNHFLTKEMIFQNMPNMDKAVTWCAQDFSEGELTTETFCLRFKTKQACDAFIDAVKVAQSKLKDESKAAKEEKNAAKQNSQPGIISSNATVSSWGEKFKPKQGSWECKECLVRNEENIENCSACNTRNPQVLSETKTLKNVNNEIKFKFGIPSQPANVANNIKTNESLNSNTTVSGWGDKFKPKQGSWECDACLVRNIPNVEICSACNNPKHGSSKPETKIPFSTENKFKFGIPQQTKDEQPKVTIKPSWGDMFKTSAGTWECKNCYVRNESNVEICCSCSTLKDSGIATKPSNTATFGGIQKNEASSIFDGTGVYKFNFGIPTDAKGQSASLFSKLGNSATSSNVSQSGNEGLISNGSQQAAKPALLPTPQIASDTSTFDFVFKPKKSPGKSSVTEKGDESDGNEYASEDEGHHIKIAPIVPLPEKVKVVTGEEDEDELFGHRAKLLIFVSGEWKERGIGVVKILRHKHTGKLRVVMRREQVFKICLNHALTPEIIYNLKDEKNWIFAANDFSEGELSLQRFCLKFKTKEIALDFKNAIDLARSGKNDLPQKSTNNEGKDVDEVQFITETQSNVEEKKKAKDLMLPENFYLYKDKEPCPGCRGCTDDHKAAAAPSKMNKEPNAETAATFSAPPQISMSTKKSIFDTSIFSSNTQNIFKISQLTESKNGANKSEPVPSLSQINTKNKTEKSIIQQPQLSLGSIKKSSLETTFGESKDSDPKSIFSTANARANKFIDFKSNENSNNAVKSTFNTSQFVQGEKTNGKSIFGGMTSSIAFKGFGSESSFTKENSQPVNEGMRGLSMKKSDEDNKANISNTSQQSATSKLQFLGNKAENEGLSFNAISNRPEISFQSNPNFKWEGAGQQLFANTQTNKKIAGNEDDTRNDGDEEYDPHYEPIVDLPDKIVVTTGEEDEEKLFGEHCKLYRFSEGSEWKERGVGELKVLYHPEKKTYRLILRRQQVHKVVLNMLLNCDFELRPMKSDRSWMFAGLNFVDGPGAHETLAARFKDLSLAQCFKETVESCVRKLQSLAAQAIREQQSEEQPKSIAHLRLPKHLQDSARADSKCLLVNAGASAMVARADSTLEGLKGDGPVQLVKAAEAPADSTAEDLTGDEEAYQYDQDEEYEAYDNEEDDRVYFSCDCEAEFQKGEVASSCARAHVQVVVAAYAPKIMVTNAATGQLLCEMLILDDLEIELSDNTCSWLGTDFFTSNSPVDTFVTVHFPDTETAVQFYNSCEECKVNSATADEES